MKYLGEYELKITDGKVEFPWENTTDKKRIWIAFECMGDCKMESSYIIIDSEDVDGFMAEMNEFGQGFKVISQGEVVLDSDNLWQVPGAIMGYLKTEEAFLCGAGTHIQIISEEDRQRYELADEEMEELLKALNDFNL